MSDNGRVGDNSDDGGEPTLAEIPLSLDAMLDILANRRRRYLLEYLRDRPDQAGSFEEATKHIIKQVSLQRGRQPNHDDIQVDLQHHHLPKLADAGVIEYDIRSQTIRYREDERLEMLYERVIEFEE